MEELKPCPFCGKKAKIYPENVQLWSSNVWVACICGVSLVQPDSETEWNMDKAIETWNRRIYSGTV